MDNNSAGNVGEQQQILWIPFVIFRGIFVTAATAVGDWCFTPVAAVEDKCLVPGSWHKAPALRVHAESGIDVTSNEFESEIEESSKRVRKCICRELT